LSPYEDLCLTVAANKLGVHCGNQWGTYLRPTLSCLSWDDIPPKSDSTKRTGKIDKKLVWTNADWYGVSDLDPCPKLVVTNISGYVADIDVQQRSMLSFFYPWEKGSKVHPKLVRCHSRTHIAVFLGSNNELKFMHRRSHVPHSTWKHIASGIIKPNVIAMEWMHDKLIFMTKDEIWIVKVDAEDLEKRIPTLKKNPIEVDFECIHKPEAPKRGKLKLISFKKHDENTFLIQRNKGHLEEYKFTPNPTGEEKMIQLTYTFKAKELFEGQKYCLHPITKKFLACHDKDAKFLLLRYNSGENTGKMIVTVNGKSRPLKVTNQKTNSKEMADMYWSKTMKDCVMYYVGKHIYRVHPDGLNSNGDMYQHERQYYTRFPTKINWFAMDNTNVEHDHRHYESETKRREEARAGPCKKAPSLGEQKWMESFAKSRKKCMDADLQVAARLGKRKLNPKAKSKAKKKKKPNSKKKKLDTEEYSGPSKKRSKKKATQPKKPSIKVSTSKLKQKNRKQKAPPKKKKGSKKKNGSKKKKARRKTSKKKAPKRKRS